MDSDETVKMVLFSILILIIGYLEYYNNKRIKDIKTQADNALTPSSLTVTAFRRDLDSIIKYVQSLSDGTLVLKSGKDTQTERMRITPGGNVGIGTNNPPSVLTISTNGASDEGVNLGKAIQTVRPSGGSIHMAMIRAGLFKWGLGYIHDTNDFGIFNTVSTDDESNTLPAMTISAGGKVGIGTATPGTTLDVNGDIWQGTQSIKVGGDADTYYPLVLKAINNIDCEFDFELSRGVHEDFYGSGSTYIHMKGNLFGWGSVPEQNTYIKVLQNPWGRPKSNVDDVVLDRLSNNIIFFVLGGGRTYHIRSRTAGIKIDNWYSTEVIPFTTTWTSSDGSHTATTGPFIPRTTTTGSLNIMGPVEFYNGVKIGISTNRPECELHVNGTAKVNSLLLSTTTRSATSGLTSDGTHLYWNTTQIA